MREITSGNQLRTVSENLKCLIVLLFTAEWCGPCKQLKPRLEQLSKQYTNVVFLKIDVDKCESLSYHFGIKSLPTIHFIKKNVILNTVTGLDIQSIHDNLTKYT